MIQSINTNLASLNAQRALQESSATLNKSIERLSTGLRINSASDDAAGMAIASRMTSQSRGIDQAMRNINDASSLASVSEGSLGEQVEMLQRVRELAVQSSNGMLSASDRQKLDNEAQSMMAEIDRVAKTTSFNGVNLLDGQNDISNGKGASFQIGANAGQTIDMHTANTTKTGLKLDNYNTSGSTGVAVAATSDQTFYINSNMSGADVATEITAEIDGSMSASEKVEAMISAINEKTSTTGVLAIAGDTGVELRTAAGVTASIDSDDAGTAFGSAGDLGLASVEIDQSGGAVDLSTQDGAMTAMLQVDSALETVQSSRSDMGSYINRFDAALSTLSTQQEGITAARSRIMDADFAMETAQMTKSQIMYNASVSMLSQANMLPQSALSLLR